MKEYATKGKLITPINACAFKVHFEALDGVQPRTAETIEDRDLLPPQMRPSLLEQNIGQQM
jgi:hypothetical protein